MVHLPRMCDRTRSVPAPLLALVGCALASSLAFARLHPAPTAKVTAVHVRAADGVTRIAIQISGHFGLKYDRLDNPDRLFFDLVGAYSAIAGKGIHTITVRDAFVRQIRVAETQHGVTRVVLDLKQPARFTTARLDNPGRLVIELHDASTPIARAPRAEFPDAPVVARRFVAPPVSRVLPDIRLNDPPVLDTWDLDLDSAAMYASAIRTRAGFLLFTPRPVGHAPRGAAIAKAARAPARTAAPESAAVSADEPAFPARVPAGASDNARPARRASEEQSMTRVLGLKIRRVVIDAGHGGHDTGTIGSAGLLEKDLVLDVALRLGKLIEERLGAEVVYTRSDDTFIPLEERTRIANASRADLFLSIHANSSPQRSASGVETYYLNFTTSQSAMDVAARENASSEKTVYELKDLLQKIALQDKIEESREFGASVQSSLYAASLRYDSRSKDRGVRKAPFVVLIGAAMPSVLAEIGFISNPHDAAALRRGENRQRIADALYKGVAKYADGLSHFTIASRDAN